MRYTEYNRKEHHNTTWSSCKLEIGRYHPSWLHPKVDIPLNIRNYHISVLSDFIRLHGSSRQFHLDFGNLFRYRFGSRFGR